MLNNTKLCLCVYHFKINLFSEFYFIKLSIQYHCITRQDL